MLSSFQQVNLQDGDPKKAYTWIDDNTNVIDNNGDISRLNIDVDTKKGTRDHSQINALL